MMKMALVRSIEGSLSGRDFNPQDIGSGIILDRTADNDEHSKYTNVNKRTIFYTLRLLIYF